MTFVDVSLAGAGRRKEQEELLHPKGFPLSLGCREQPVRGSSRLWGCGKHGAERRAAGPAEPACATCRHIAARSWGSALDISCLILFPITRLAELCQHAEELENNSSCGCLSSLLASRHPPYPSQPSNAVYFSSEQRSALRCLAVWLRSCSTDLPVCSQRLLRTHLVLGRMVPGTAPGGLWVARALLALLVALWVTPGKVTHFSGPYFSSSICLV